MQVPLGQPGIMIQRGGQNSKLVQMEEVQQQVPLSNQIQVQQRDLCVTSLWVPLLLCTTLTVLHTVGTIRVQVLLPQNVNLYFLKPVIFALSSVQSLSRVRLFATP